MILLLLFESLCIFVDDARLKDEREGCTKILLPTIIVASTKVIYRFGIILLVMCSAIINDGHGSTQKGQKDHAFFLSCGTLIVGSVVSSSF
jgi:hypothetical protein